MSDDPPDAVEFLIVNLKAVLSVNYISVALLTVMVYDTILTMPREIKFVWETGGVSLRKVLYIVIRYYALISLAVIVRTALGLNLTIKVSSLTSSCPATISHILDGRGKHLASLKKTDRTEHVYSCRVYIDWFTSSGLPLEEALVNLLLILRINALYGGQRKVLFFILALYLIELVLFLYAGARAGRAVPLAPLPVELSLPGCLVYVMGSPKFTFTLLAWIPAFVFSAILLAFSVYKVREDLVPVASSSRGFASLNQYHPLLLAIFQQGVVFYIVNTVITLLNAAFVIKIHVALNTVAVPIGIVAYSICGCRFLLSFHERSNNVLHDVGDTDGVVVFHNDTTNEAYMLNAL